MRVRRDQKKSVEGDLFCFDLLFCFGFFPLLLSAFLLFCFSAFLVVLAADASRLASVQQFAPAKIGERAAPRSHAAQTGVGCSKNSLAVLFLKRAQKVLLPTKKKKKKKKKKKAKTVNAGPFSPFSLPLLSLAHSPSVMRGVAAWKMRKEKEGRKGVLISPATHLPCTQPASQPASQLPSERASPASPTQPTQPTQPCLCHARMCHPQAAATMKNTAATAAAATTLHPPNAWRKIPGKKRPRRPRPQQLLHVRQSSWIISSKPRTTKTPLQASRQTTTTTMTMNSTSRFSACTARSSCTASSCIPRR